jgi:hypothetical protein
MTVEEFQNEFAKAYCAAEASEFLPYLRGKVDFSTQRRADQTNNASKRTKLPRPFELM